MSVKKILLLTAAAVATVGMTGAIAGGYTTEPQAEPAPMTENGYYIEGNAGYGIQDYYDQSNWRAGGIQSSGSNVKGGFAGGADAGYLINQRYAIELGWDHLPDVNVANSGSATLSSWVLYLAAKYMVPLSWHDTDWFFKVGVDYRRATMPSSMVTQYNVTTGSTSFVRPMFATGFDMGFAGAWNAILQYAYFMGARNSFPYNTANAGSLGTVAANVITLGLGYKFMM